MNYKDVLKEAGFLFSDEYELWIRREGFGQTISVEMFMKGLFTIKKGQRSFTTGGVLIYDGFIETFQEFKDIIKQL